MPTALIADDEPHLAQHLRQLLAQAWPALQVLPLARNGPEAAQAIERLAPDLAFLDIKMPGATGLEVAQGIEGPTRVVFVTAYDQFAVQAFEAEALDYLLKPVQAERLAQCVQRLQRALAAPAPGTDGDPRLAAALARLAATTAAITPAAPRLQWVRAGAGDRTHQVPLQEVLYFQADDKYTCVVTATAEHVIRTPLHELLAQLDPQHWQQVHRSTVVNLHHLAGTRRDEASRLWLQLRGHHRELPVSRAYVHLFKAM